MVVALARTQSAQRQGRTGNWPDLLQRVYRLDDAGRDGFTRSWIMMFPIGTFNHPEYGTLNFSQARLSDIKRNFDRRVRKIDIALDSNHDQDRATGWVEQLQFADAGHTPDGKPVLGDTPAGLWALVRWTPLGLQLLRDQEYRYFSPEFGPWPDPETGQKYANVLLGGGLTNRPFLKAMPAIMLAELAEVSRKPWGGINKSKLPRSCFLIPGDPDDKESWKLPVYEGAGPMDADGHYTKRGPLNINGVRAALQAIGGSRTGTPMSGVNGGVRAKLQRWMKMYGASSGGDGGGGDGGSTASEGRMTAGDRKALRQWVNASSRNTRQGRNMAVELDGYSTRVAHRRRTDVEDAPDGAYNLDDDGSDDDSYNFADGDDDTTSGDGSNKRELGFDGMSDRHPAMTCKEHTHGKYGPHGHDGDADHSDAPLKSDGKDGDGADGDGADGDGDDGSQYAEQKDAEDEEDDSPSDRAQDDSQTWENGDDNTFEGTSANRGENAPGGKQGPRMGGVRSGFPGKVNQIKATPGKGAKMTETMRLAEVERQLREERQQRKSLQEEHDKVVFRLYEQDVAKRLAGWQNGKFQFTEGKTQDGKSVKRTGAVGYSRVFGSKYRAFMLSDGLRLGERTRRAIDELVESALSSAVDLTARGSSFDMEERRTRRLAEIGKPTEKQANDLVAVASRIARERGKTLSELSSEELLTIYDVAQQEVDYR